MAVADLLRDVGQGAAAAGRAVGAVAEPVLARTSEVVSGEAPQIDEENRRQQEQLEDAQIEAKAKELENGLAIGQKYGTLDPKQQQDYIDAITDLYSHPRHAPKLMDKLRQAVHPNGMFAQGPESRPLANPTPAGGTATADENARAASLAEQMRLRQDISDEEIDRRANEPKHSTAKSPPLTGDKLPGDAVGPDGQPISQGDRNAGKSFVEWNGAWWPVAKPKPVMKQIKGHLVLLDPQTGQAIRDLGPTQTAKVTTRQTLQPGDDGQMHLVNLTSVTTPEGATIDVQPDDSQISQATAPTSGGKAPSSPATAPKTPAKKVTPGTLLPKTGAKPAASQQAGPVVPGLSTLAKSKNPLWKADVSSYKKAHDDAVAKQEAYKNASGLLADNSRVTDLELAYSWVRANVQGAGRMTNTEIQQTFKAGGFDTRIRNMISQASSGRFAPELEKQFLSDIKRSADNAQSQADQLKNQLGDAAPADTTPAPANSSGDSAVDKFLQNF